MATRHGRYNFGEENPPLSTYHNRGKFGRLFPTLPPFASDTPTMREALNDIGKADGIMDAKDDLSDPITSITNPAKSLHNPDNPDLSAGFTFLGQFLDHDLTFDPTSSLNASRIQKRLRISARRCSSWTTSTAPAPMHRHTSTIRRRKRRNSTLRRSPSLQRRRAMALPSSTFRAIGSLQV
jgi:hypothetical protein